MAVMSAEPDQYAGMLTVADLDALPEDNLRHELVDGAFFMTPSPIVAHQVVVAVLCRELWQPLASTDLLAVPGPVDLLLPNPVSGTDVLVPDVVVIHRADLGAKRLTTPPALVVEVRSPSTASMDRVRKREIYQRAGIPNYWLLDPAEPSAEVLELREGRYEQVGYVTGDNWLAVERPVAVRLNPAILLQG